MRTGNGNTALKYKILALDIDGTLLRSDGTISDRTRSSLSALHDSGVKVVLCTGRRFRTARKFSDQLGFDLPIITNCGSLIKDSVTGETMYCRFFPKPLADDLVTFLLQRSNSVLLFLNSPLEANLDFFAFRNEGSSEAYRKYLEKHRGVYRILEEYCGLAENTELVEICVVEHREHLQRIQVDVQAQFGSRISSHLMGSVPVLGPVYEIFASATSKWNALVHWAEGLGVSPREIACAGDEMNDREMILKAGLGAAMGNAVKEIKAVADIVLPHNDEDGLVVLAQRLISINRSD